MEKIYDLIIVGGGPAGLFASIKSPFFLEKLILEKNESLGVKLLLSGGERANISNRNINPLNDYFGKNKKALISIFNKFSNYDLISYLHDNGIITKEEDNGRIILKSSDSREILHFLLKESKKNNTLIKTNSSVTKIKKENDIFIITTKNKVFLSKNLLITTGGKSFFQVGTTGDGYRFGEKFGHSLLPLHRGLTGLVTQKDLKEISGIGTNLHIKIFSKINNKIIYEEFGPILFTHFGLSGPIIYNSVLAIGEYFNNINKKNLSNIENNDVIDRDFLKENIIIKLEFQLENTPKRVKNFFSLGENDYELNLNCIDYRSWKEAKVTLGGINIDELNGNLESKIVKNLYFAGEILDITGKTGGYNLQFAFSSGFVVGNSFLNNK